MGKMMDSSEENKLIIDDHREFSEEFRRLARVVEKRLGTSNTLTPKVKAVAEIMENMTDEEIMNLYAASGEMEDEEKTDTNDSKSTQTQNPT